MLNIYHVPHTRSMRIIWLCEELELPYEVTPVDFSKSFRATPEWRKLNPVGKVPVLTDSDLVMFESGAMLHYILDRYGAGRLQPNHGSPEHAHFLQWSWFAEATFARPLGEIFNHRREFPGDQEIPAVIAEMQHRGRECLNAVDAHLEDCTYLLGSEFSGADIMLGYSLYLACLSGIFQGTEDSACTNAAGYWNRLENRPAFKAAQTYNN